VLLCSRGSDDVTTVDLYRRCCDLLLVCVRPLCCGVSAVVDERWLLLLLCVLMMSLASLVYYWLD